MGGTEGQREEERVSQVLAFCFCIHTQIHRYIHRYIHTYAHIHAPISCVHICMDVYIISCIETVMTRKMQGIVRHRA